MSLILDALNRSREDSSTVPGLATRHEFSDEKPDRRILILGTVLVFALVAIAWLLWDKRQEETPNAGAVQLGNAVEAAASPSRPATVPAVSAPAVLDQNPPEPVQSEQASASIKEVAVTPANAEVSTAVVTETEKQQPTATEIEALYQPAATASTDAKASAAGSVTASAAAAPAAAAPVREERNMDIEQLLNQAENELKDAQLEEHPAPFIKDLSQQTKDGIPTVYYQRHEYSGRPAQSRVVLNGKKLKKGDSPVGGMQVVEILADSVVLSYDGTEFRLRALNSWVNL